MWFGPKHAFNNQVTGLKIAISTKMSHHCVHISAQALMILDNNYYCDSNYD